MDANVHYEWYGDEYSYRKIPSDELNITLAPLTDRLRAYDKLRLKLEEQGGDTEDLGQVAELLSSAIRISAFGRVTELSLKDASGLARALDHVGLYEVFLDVRQLGSGMPVYYLCRTHGSYWSEYWLVVDDLYMSPGYPMRDSRFARFMRQGHETFFLRLSPFRSGLQDALGLHGFGLDDFLVDLGQNVFHAAWHEDQQTGVVVADHFHLPRFRQALELLYLNLSGELCEVRRSLNENTVLFFETVYRQAAIAGFLRLLQKLDGAALNELPERALKLYGRLSTSFNAFLDVEVPWGNRRLRSPLFRLVFANFDRLESVGRTLRDDAGIHEAAKRLEGESAAIICDIVSDYEPD